MTKPTDFDGSTGTSPPWPAPSPTEWLRERLAAGPVDVLQVYGTGDADDFGEGTLDAAAAELGVLIVTSTDGVRTWALPTDEVTP